METTESLPIQLHNLLKSEFPNSSANLRKFADGKKYSYLEHHYRIYQDADGDLHLGFVGDNGLFCGRNLMRLACGQFDTFAYSLKTPMDVTQWFIDAYSAAGMCAYTDMRHEWREDHDDNAPDGTTRTCIHCGKVEMLHSELVLKTWWGEPL